MTDWPCRSCPGRSGAVRPCLAVGSGQRPYGDHLGRRGDVRTQEAELILPQVTSRLQLCRSCAGGTNINILILICSYCFWLLDQPVPKCLCVYTVCVCIYWMYILCMYMCIDMFIYWMCAAIFCPVLNLFLVQQLHSNNLKGFPGHVTTPQHSFLLPVTPAWKQKVQCVFHIYCSLKAPPAARRTFWL